MHIDVIPCTRLQEPGIKAREKQSSFRLIKASKSSLGIKARGDGQDKPQRASARPCNSVLVWTKAKAHSAEA